MPNHLTPEELSKEFGIDRAEVIRICVEEHVPVYHGRIDKTLFEAVRLIHLEPSRRTRPARPDGRLAPEFGPDPARVRARSRYPRCVRARSVRPLVLVSLALALPALQTTPAPAATGPRERAALLELFATDAALVRARHGETAAQDAARARARRSAERARAPGHRAQQPARRAARARAAAERDLPRPAARRAGRAAGGALVERHQRGARPARPPLARGQLARPLRAPLARDAARASRARCTRPSSARRPSSADGRRAWPSCGGPAGAHRALLAELRRAARARAAGAREDRPARRRARAHGRAAPAARRRQRQLAAAAAARPRRRWPRARRCRSSATAYSLPGHTASGLPVGQGICATDPRVIPLGTRFDIPGYGSCVAADTGSSVVGATIDIWMPRAQAAVYGGQTITITFR